MTGEHRRSLLLALCNAVRAFVTRMYVARAEHAGDVNCDERAYFKCGDVTVELKPMPVCSLCLFCFLDLSSIYVLNFDFH